MDVGDLNSIAMGLKKIRAQTSALFLMAQNDNLEPLGSDQATIMLDDIILELDDAMEILGKPGKTVHSRTQCEDWGNLALHKKDQGDFART